MDSSDEHVADLQRRLDQALAQQAATAGVLKVISRSTFDLQAVLDTLVTSAAQLCSADAGIIWLRKGELFHADATVGFSPEEMAFFRDHPRSINDKSLAPRVLRSGRTEHIPDRSLDPEFAFSGSPSLPTSMLGVPLLRNGRVEGVFTLTRTKVAPFTPRQIELVESFADQSMIAIENTRLINETREALERQTATAEILKVIASSPSDLQPVFDAIAISSKQLIGGFSCTVFRLIDGMVHLVAYTPVNPAADEVLRASFPRPVGEMALFDTAKGSDVVEESDAEENPDPQLRELARARGFRGNVFARLMSKGTPIGLISVTRKEPGKFAKHHIQLLQTFADQAVIAIENARLFNEVQAKTRDLSESLQHQTATADVLKVISRSVFDLQTVLDTLVESAYRLCAAKLGLLYLKGDEAFECRAIAGSGVEDANAYFKGRPIRAGRATAAERVIMTGEVESVTDFFADLEFDPDAKEIIRKSGNSGLGVLRSTLAVPMTRDGTVTGVLVIASAQTGAFPQRQIDLLQTFADQAVIAIENTRLFNETKEALERQTATADILKVIASSPSDVQPVFEAIAERSSRLIGGLSTAVYSIVDDAMHLMAFTRSNPEADAALQASFPRPLSEADWGDRIRNREVVEIPDAQMEWAEQPRLRDVVRLRGFRSLLLVPLLRDGTTIGIISVTRREPGRFAPHHVQLLQTFADQAVIAIGNVELFKQVQQRTLELSQSLDDLRTAQDRLVQTEKLASLGQLTAGIAHEIKNPLNFVNNFSSLSAELVDEMTEVFENSALDEAGRRRELDEIRELLKGNLEKVVQHGKRADSIVKNMLQHSREGSGEHRSADINAIVEDSLNLAYHGARAEKSGFAITLRQDLDPTAGAADLYPQEITRALLNLISNGFYAANRRKADSGDDSFEPMLSASTRNLGNAVEIRIRDNGTGIPPEVKDKMFLPFFTTKPTGEGTGLGLSMTHDIIVKQHGGRIDVETEPGEFSELIITLPRGNGTTGV